MKVPPEALNAVLDWTPGKASNSRLLRLAGEARPYCFPLCTPKAYAGSFSRILVSGCNESSVPFTVNVALVRETALPTCCFALSSTELPLTVWWRNWPSHLGRRLGCQLVCQAGGHRIGLLFLGPNILPIYKESLQAPDRFQNQTDTHAGFYKRLPCSEVPSAHQVPK